MRDKTHHIYLKSCSPTELLLNALQPTTIAATMMINSHHLCIMKLLAAKIGRASCRERV